MPPSVYVRPTRSLPPPFPPRVPPQLLQFDDVVVTPHCAGRAPESQAAATALIRANLNAHFSGKPLPTPVAATK